MADANVRATSHVLHQSIASGATSAPITLPTGLSVGDPLEVFVAADQTATVGVVTAPTGWTLDVAQTTMGTGSFFVLKRTGGWQTADGTSLTVTLSSVTAAMHWSYVAVGLDGSKISDWGTPGTITKRSSSVTTTTATGTGSVGQDIFTVFFCKMSSNNGTPTVTPDATLVDQAQPTGSANENVWIGSYTPGTVETQTITYSAASGNGAGYQVPLTAAAPSAQNIAPSGITTAEAFGTAAVSTGAPSIAPSGIASAEAFGTASVTTTSPPTVYPQAGGVTSSSFEVRFATTNVTSARVAVSTSSSMTSPTYTTTLTPDSDGIVAASITGLTADTNYWYAIEANGTLLTGAGQVGAAHTFPTTGTPTNFSYLFGSCQFTDSNHAIFTEIKNYATPHTNMGFLHLGDLHYRDWQTNSISDAPTIKAQQKSSTQQSNFAALLATMPWNYIWDNHDWGGKDSDATNPAASVLEAMYRQMLPHYPMLSDTDDHSGAIDHQWQVGRVAFYAMDTRSQRTNYTATDNSSKTMLGAGQKARLKNWMSTNTAPVKILVLGIPWKDYGGATGDRWGSYLTEFSELNTYFNSNGIGKLYAISGDLHVNTADDGTNESYGHVPNAVASAFDQSGTPPTSGWSQGAYPASGTSTNHLFGLLDITDTGSLITINYTGLDSTGTSNITMTTTVNTTQTVSPSGTSTAEAFGTAAVAPGAVTVSPSGIISDEAFGSSLVSPGAVTLSPTGITSDELFGTDTVTVGSVNISTTGIGSSEAFGSPLVSTGALTIIPSGIASAEAFGSDSISVGAVSISPSGIASAEAFGTARVAFPSLAPLVVGAINGPSVVTQTFTGPTMITISITGITVERTVDGATMKTIDATGNQTSDILDGVSTRNTAIPDGPAVGYVTTGPGM